MSRLHLLIRLEINAVSHHDHGNLWKSYERSLQHVFNYNKHGGQARAHISTVQNLARPVLIAFLLCALGMTLGQLVTYKLTRGQLYQQQLSYLLVYYSIFMFTSIVALIVKNLIFRKLSHFFDFLIIVGLTVATTSLSLLYSYQLYLWITQVLGCLSLILIGKFLFRQYSYAGINFYLGSCLGIVIGLAWGIEFFIALPISPTTKFLVLFTSPLLLIKLPSGFLHMLELYDIVCREQWRKMRHPYSEKLKSYLPFVSIHVPTYSEPPELVIETINKLAAVDYENYEVIVIDNNTKDPALWLPVQAHCEKLGEKFRFIHADNIEGAKGGALNYIHKYIDVRASLIAVIDADYQVDPGFLKALVGHFENPKVGFIQTPHDYRAWQDNLFLTMCYWEYKIFFHSAMISLNERDAGITVGTMCIVRKEALEQAGGWSEWCVTEDSELAIRIHDIGYSSIYIDKTYGRGLIPDSFEGYKKQRYRWTAGPVQEFRYHVKHFIGLSKRKTEFSFVQRIFHLNHGLANVLLAFNIPYIIIGISIAASMILHEEVVKVPFELWIGATVTLFATPLMMYLLYRVTVKATMGQIIGQAIATKALSHVIAHAALRTTLTGSAQWNRTSKFKSTQSYTAALYSTKEEIAIGMILLVFVITSYLMFPYQGLSLMLLIGISYLSLEYFAAPFMALVGVWSFRHESSDPSSNTM